MDIIYLPIVKKMVVGCLINQDQNKLPLDLQKLLKTFLCPLFPYAHTNTKPFDNCGDKLRVQYIHRPFITYLIQFQSG